MFFASLRKMCEKFWVNGEVLSIGNVIVDSIFLNCGGMNIE